MAKVEVEVTNQASKRLFGLKTVALAFEYGAFMGFVAGGVGGFLLARTYDSQDLSRTEKMGKMGRLTAYGFGGIITFMGAIKLISSFKIKG